MANLLITGGAGYIGSHTLRALRRAGHDTVAIDDLRAGSEAEATHGAPLVQRDVGDRDALDRSFERFGPFDGVLHFAAYLAVGESVVNPMKYYRNNVAASVTLIEACVAHGVRAFVFSSSCAVYGNPDRQPMDEDTPRAPVNPYGMSKFIVEQMLADATAAHGMGHIALRYFNAAGADPAGGLGERHDPETHLVPLALEAAAGLRPELSLFGTDYPTPDGTCIRDYIHVNDLADAHLRAMEALLDGEESGAYNLGTGTGSSCREVLAAAERVTGRPVPVRETERRPGDPPALVADPRRFAARFGWAPRTSDLDTIVRHAWDWLREWRGLPDGDSSPSRSVRTR